MTGGFQLDRDSRISVNVSRLGVEFILIAGLVFSDVSSHLNHS